MNDHDLLIRIDENVEAIKQHAQTHQDKDDAIHKGLDDRIRLLEATRQSQKGAITVIAAVVSAGWAILLAGIEMLWSHK